MKTCLVLAVSLWLGLMAAIPAGAQGTFKVEQGETFNKMVPRDFVLEENAIPTEKRNTSLVLTPPGTRMLVGLLDTSGYSSQVQEKYLGMLIAEGSIEVCGHQIGVGSYGFGLVKTAGATEGKPATFTLYNQAGKRVVSCPAKWDSQLTSPRPLQVVVSGGRTARLYLSRNWIEFK